jgi:hypothetical protein
MCPLVVPLPHQRAHWSGSAVRAEHYPGQRAVVTVPEMTVMTAAEVVASSQMT